METKEAVKKLIKEKFSQLSKKELERIHLMIKKVKKKHKSS